MPVWPLHVRHVNSNNAQFTCGTSLYALLSLSLLCACTLQCRLRRPVMKAASLSSDRASKSGDLPLLRRTGMKKGFFACSHMSLLHQFPFMQAPDISLLVLPFSMCFFKFRFRLHVRSSLHACLINCALFCLAECEYGSRYSIYLFWSPARARFNLTVHAQCFAEDTSCE